MKNMTLLCFCGAIFTLMLTSPGVGFAQQPSKTGLSDQKMERSAGKARYGYVRIFTTGAAKVTVDGKAYPRRSEFGLKITAGERHEVVVTLGDKKKTYAIMVKARELRTLMVDLSGYQTPAAVGSAAAPTNIKPSDAAPKETSASEEKGKLTVYSKPKGEVFVDGSPVGATTPMINRELDLGRHEVQVRWENGEMSEVKTVRIRKGSKLKLFFRDRSNNVK